MNLKHIMIMIGATMLLSGCTTKYPRLTEPDEGYRQALEATANQSPDRPEEALKSVMDLFTDYTYDNLKQNIQLVYDENLYFRDGFKQIDTIPDLETYILHSTEPLQSCTFTFEPPVFNAPDYYLLWTMHVSFKSDKKGKVENAIGMSRIRFNKEGKVVFQQDYWDPTDILYRKIPVANGLIGYVRNRL